MIEYNNYYNNILPTEGYIPTLHEAKKRFIKNCSRLQDGRYMIDGYKNGKLFCGVEVLVEQGTITFGETNYF